MSRTIRKPYGRFHWSDVYKSRETYIDEEIHSSGTTFHFRRKRTESELKEAQENINQIVSHRIAMNGGSNVFKYSWRDGYYILTPWKPSKVTSYSKDMGYEYAYKYYGKQWDKMFRDGKLSETGRKKAFKQDCSRTNRRNNRRFCKKVMKDDWEDLPNPTHHETDYLVWTYW